LIPHELADRFRLGWSHTVTPVTLSDANERRFYAVGAVAGSSGVRELERQIDSGLFERLALSRNKNEVKKLADRGLVVEQAAAVIENLYWQDAQRCLGPRPGESGVGQELPPRRTFRIDVQFLAGSSAGP
jgi:hypothetical protein